MKKLCLIAVLFVALFVAAGVVMAQEEATTESAAPAMEAAAPAIEATAVNVGNKVCPVTGEKIEKLGENTVEYEGKVYNLCCPMCKEKFLAEPAKYTAIVEEELKKEAEAAPAETM